MKIDTLQGRPAREKVRFTLLKLGEKQRQHSKIHEEESILLLTVLVQKTERKSRDSSVLH
jgi:hypothetical protein